MLHLLFGLLVVGIAVVFSVYVFAKLSCGFVKNNVSLVGKTAIVTGGASGIGYEVVAILLSRGCKVIVADVSLHENVHQELIEKTGNCNVIIKHLDLASIRSIKSFAADILNQEQRLDILIHNAGIGVSEKVTSEDGINTVFQVNCYGPLLLTHLLLDLLKKSAPSRIIFTSALMAFMNTLSEENVNPICEKYNLYNSSIDFANSSMGAILIANGFAKKLQGTGVTSNSLHPGVATTPFKQKICIVTKQYLLCFVYYKLFLKIVGKDPWESAQTTVHLATDKSLENISGKHFWDCKEFYMPSLAKNEEFTNTFWELAMKIVNIKEK